MNGNFNVIEFLDCSAAILIIEAIASPVTRLSAFNVGLALKSINRSWARRSDR